MKILSFDIEEWYIEKEFRGGRKEQYQKFDHYLKEILDLLDEQQTKATFMCVGELAHSFPYVIKDIAAHGHEIGCHSNVHDWLTKLTPKQLRRDTYDAITVLEDITGKKVRCYRAPAFSIGEQNKYALEILAEYGIEIDSSIFPAVRDFGGFPSFFFEEPTVIKINGCELKEFPMCTTNIFGKRVVYSGGGYFRIFPLPFIKSWMNKSNYAISYFHIGDLVRSSDQFLISKEMYETYFREPGTLTKRVKRSIKSNLGISGAFEKMCKLICNTDFVSLERAEKIVDWSKAKVVEL
jgi:polysaccharide deacetylase family protein (PEP-CTERM system associated)